MQIWTRHGNQTRGLSQSLQEAANQGGCLTSQPFCVYRKARLIMQLPGYQARIVEKYNISPQ